MCVINVTYLFVYVFTFSGNFRIASSDANLFEEKRVGTGPARRSPSNISASRFQDCRIWVGAESLKYYI